MSEPSQHLRMVEALLFAAAEPLDEATFAARMPEDADVPGLLQELAAQYEHRGVNLVKVAEKWQFRTAPDLRFLLEAEKQETKRLSRAALETLAIIAYHQPVTRAEVEEIRGVSLSKGTLDLLMEIGWVRMRGRRRTPGRPVTYGITDGFLSHFGLESGRDLPGLEDLKAAGLLDSVPPPELLPRPPGEEAEDPLDEKDRPEPEALPLDTPAAEADEDGSGEASAPARERKPATDGAAEQAPEQTAEQPEALRRAASRGQDES